ncbi:hypothetical protein D1BOALGB6SA_4138 [Olavius sp. associated proteobacterium Delta 1]|nr:hypothetical protein D1BOALGB6SA_4138 [Olavius sp. associated proteobacterium Delta 1]
MSKNYFKQHFRSLWTNELNYFLNPPDICPCRAILNEFPPLGI